MMQKQLLKISLCFLAITTGIYVTLVFLAGTGYYNYCSVTSLLFGISFTAIIFKDFDNKEYFGKMETQVTYYKEKIKPAAFLIVLGNGLLGFLALYLLYERVNFADSKDLKSVIIISGGFGIIIAQIGGWIIQSFLINLLCVFFGSKNSPKVFFNLVGLSYIGFLLITVLSILLNPFILPNQIKAEELNEIIFSSNWHVISGKTGEFIVLSIIIFGILSIERISVTKAVVISVVPSLLLLAFNLLFQNII